MGLTLTGDKQLEKKFRQMEPKVRKKIERSSVRKAAKPVLEQAKDNVPVQTGELKRSLKIRALKRSRKNKHIVGVQVVTAEGWFKGDTYYGGFVELGTSHAPAHPYLRPALHQRQEEAKSIFRSEFKQAIKEAADG